METEHSSTAQDMKPLDVPAHVTDALAALNTRVDAVVETLNEVPMSEQTAKEMSQLRERIDTIERAVSRFARGGADSHLFDTIFGHLGIARPERD